MTHVFYMLKKYIEESFYNPILHILPVFTLLVFEDFFGMLPAWGLSLIITLSLLAYSKTCYNSIFFWQLYSAIMWLLIGVIVSISYLFDIRDEYRFVLGEFVAAVFFLISILFKHRVEQIIIKNSSRKLSMKNNLYEFERLLILLAVLLFLYVDIYIGVVSLYDNPGQRTMKLISSMYLFVLTGILSYEFIRVHFVRSQLIKEEWWPIVNETGKQIGTIQQHASLWDERKYIHPVVRVMILKGNRIFLQQKSGSSVFTHDWDVPIITHIRVGESPEEAIQRQLKPEISPADVNFVFLTNYMLEEAQEYQFVNLFLGSTLEHKLLEDPKLRHQKWWTIGQIEDNMDSGIFSEQFKKEFEILKHSGLVISSFCDCDCKLKETFSQ